MSSEEDRLRHSQRRKKDILNKRINDGKGAFSLRVPDPRKGEYKRKHFRVNEVDEIYDDERDDGGSLYD